MKSSFYPLALAVAMLGQAASANAQTAPFVVDVTGALSISSLVRFGINEVRTFQIGAGAHITGVSYEVTIDAFAPSPLSEAMLEIAGSDIELGGAVIVPGRGVLESGTQTFRGSLNLVDRGLDFWIGDDGILRLEFFEAYDDEIGGVGNVPNAIWRTGTLSFQYTPATAVPEPSTWLMLALGLGAIGAAARRQRWQAARA